jgi:hypothetical protein
MGKLRQNPETQRVQAIFFAKDKMWDQIKIRDWLSLHPHYMASTPANKPVDGSTISESLVKHSAEPVLPINEVANLIESVLPSSLVQRSWSLGPQRMCQELRRIILKLRKLRESHFGDCE